LCREDCTGPDPDAHPVTTVPDAAESSDDEVPPSGDPRWAALDALHFDNN
jgi:uncharacterized protein